ncbi:MAG: PIG-L family deacetylase [Armatimonadetes bacterium]|nr:PIG-L family deacetylase [Armatimonadota bacterium]
MGLARRYRWLLLLLPVLAGTARVAAAQGLVDLAQHLQALGTTARVLHVAAHPDDEDSALLAALVRERGAQTIYLSLTRGEGGQNSIGPELGPALGLLRTHELLAARAIDGAEQTFGACYDFGFSKSANEALRLWGEQAALGDIVLAIRRYRPQVVVQRFAGDPGDGHGHHQASGLLCRRAFRAAADPTQFPEQIAAGYLPWQAQRLYLDRGALPGADCLVPLGNWLPLYGRSPAELAALGRSQHRSQDMGMVQPLGQAASRLKVLDSTVPTRPTDDLLAGLDLSLVGLAGGDARLRAVLGEAQEAVTTASASLPGVGLYPRTIVGETAKALRALRRADELMDDGAPPTSDSATQRLAVRSKIALAQLALAEAAGVRLDALCDHGLLTPGEQATVSAQALAPLSTPLDTVRITLNTPQGWPNQALDGPPPLLGNGPGQVAMGFAVTAPSSAEPLPPSWLRAPRAGWRYTVPNLRDLGRPLDPPPLTVTLATVVDGVPLTITRPVEYRWSDPRLGERRRAVALVPAVTGRPLDAVILHAPGQDPPPAQLKLDNVQPSVVDVPALDGPLQVPGSAAPLLTLHSVAYEHLPPYVWLEPARLRVAEVAVKLATDRRIGVVVGPEDETMPALRRLGLKPRVLDDAALASGAFEGLNTIVIGARAYETNPALGAANARLLDWARAGGTLVVFYQKYPFATGRFAPFPIGFAQPHDRVTDETAEVRLLQPDHPLLTTPNRLGAPDFDGWTQERGLYFAGTHDPAYTPLLASHDPGEPDKDGIMLTASVGTGRYVYCALALFRQWPAGVPGAYRLLANLVSWGG